MYLTPLRARAFFVAAASAALLAACSGAGQSVTPSAGLAQQSAAEGASRTSQSHSFTPTPAPSGTPGGRVHYKIITALVMDGAGNFFEESAECRKHADAFESETDISLTVAHTTTLPVCTTDSDRHRGDDAHVIMSRTFQPTPTPIPTPTATPGVLTDLVIISRTNRDDDEGGGGTVVLTGGANLYNGVWTFTSLGNPLVIQAERHYHFYVAEPVACNDEDCGRDHHHHHSGGDND